MSIDRSQTPTSAGQVREADAPRKGEPAREPPPKENVDRFRQLMQSKQEAKDEFLSARRQDAGKLQGQQRADAQAAEQHASPDAVDAGRQHSGDTQERELQQTMDPAEVLAMMQAQVALRDGAHVAQTAPPPAVNTSAFTDLVERHVRQLAVGNSGDARDGQVLLRMADSTLPGTDLLLSRTADGWLLRADVRSRGSYDAIREAAPELAKRFAERNLGTLEIAPEFHG